MLLSVIGLLSASALPAAVLFNSPVGSWDFVESGNRSGIAFITFADDNTLSGYEIIVPRVRTNTVAEAVNGSPGAGPAPGPGTSANLFGFVPFSGLWNYDVRGQVIGFWAESVDQVCQTNITITSMTVTNAGTNMIVQTTNRVINCNGPTTNSVSFVGKVTPGKRFTWVAFTAGGNVSFRGVPFITLTNLEGSYYGNKLQQRNRFTEFFTLAAAGFSGAAANTYLVNGSGGGYAYTNGIAMLSSQKQLAMVMITGDGTGFDPSSSTLRSVMGSYNAKRQTGSLKGVEQGSGTLTNTITFQITKLPNIP
jgi:hypothetical protein